MCAFSMQQLSHKVRCPVLPAFASEGYGGGVVCSVSHQREALWNVQEP